MASRMASPTAFRAHETGAHDVARNTRVLLEGTIVPTLLRLAVPNVLMIAVQILASAAEAYFLGWLGTDVLAGAALVFPLITLCQTMSAGAMGGAVSSAIARALGAGRREDANVLALHALLIAVVLGTSFSIILLTAGPPLYQALGGTGATLEAALIYSNIVFAGAVALWLFNTLASIIRGTGNMIVPSATVISGAALMLAISPTLIVGWGPMPSLGIAGAGIALVAYYAIGAAVLLAFLLSRRSLLRLPAREARRVRVGPLRAILRVGAPGLVNTFQANLTIILMTGLVARFGTDALAGYGLAARLEFLQLMLIFGLGTALVTMVATNLGAGQLARARRIAWVGAGVAATISGAIGVSVALVPAAWLRFFSTEPSVVAAGSSYLRIVGPTYAFLGTGFALYFASQGAGRLHWPLLAGFSRLVVAIGVGWLAVAWWSGGLASLFAVNAAAIVVFGGFLAIAVRADAWS